MIGCSGQPRAAGIIVYREMRERRAARGSMKEIVRTNDPALISWLQALLRDAGIEAVLFDSHTSILEGSAGAIPRRLMVADDDYAAARKALEQAGEGAHLV